MLVTLLYPGTDQIPSRVHLSQEGFILGWWDGSVGEGNATKPNTRSLGPHSGRRALPLGSCLSSELCVHIGRLTHRSRERSPAPAIAFVPCLHHSLRVSVPIACVVPSYALGHWAE